MSPYRFTELKAFLRAHIQQLPHRGRGEISHIAQHLRVSASLVSQVLSGDKLFTPEQAQALAEYLQLAPLETEYIAYLTQKERAGSRALRTLWERKLAELRERSLKVANRVATDRAITEEEKSVFYSSPIYAALSLFTSLGEQGKTLAEICERFELSRPKALQILEFLLKTDLCRQKGDRYFQGAQKTHLEEGSPHILRHHSNWRLRAISRCEDLAKTELMYSAPISLSRIDFDLLREEMVEFLKRFLAKVHESPAEEIACFNMDFFWIKK